MYRTDKTKTGLTLYTTRDDYWKLDKLLLKKGYELINIIDYTYYNNPRYEERYDIMVGYINTKEEERQTLKKQHEQHLRSVYIT